MTRLDFANWLVSPKNPLTARTFVNRLWRIYFGEGLTRTLEDLGSQGEWPSHPELLDWLAVEFRESGWNVKHLVKLIVMSSTYRQTSQVSAQLQDHDPVNRLLGRQARFRLDAELVRDNALAISGLLDATIGGPSAKPYQPAGYYAHNLQPAYPMTSRCVQALLWACRVAELKPHRLVTLVLLVLAPAMAPRPSVQLLRSRGSSPPP